MADTNNEATSPAPAALIVHGIPVGVPVPVDAELDPTSDNPVNNKAVCEKFDEIDTRLARIELTDFFTTTPYLSAYVVYLVGSMAYIYATVKNGGTASTWLNCATVNTTKYRIDAKVSATCMNGTQIGQVALAKSGGLDRFVANQNASFDFTMVVPVTVLQVN